MTRRRIASLALALIAFAATSGATLARAEIGKTAESAAINVSMTVVEKCSLDAMDVSCERAEAPRLEQSGVYTLQIDGQQARFTTATVNF
jgi:hypothetical protein